MNKCWETNSEILGANNTQKVWEQAPDIFWGTLFPNFPTPGIDKISDREIGSDEYILRKVTFRIEKSNPLNILWNKYVLSWNIFFLSK